MKKETFKTRKTADKIIEVEGYKFDLLLGDNTVKRMGVYNSGKSWVVVDLSTGLMLCESVTRTDAITRAKSESMVAAFTKLVNGDRYKDNLFEKEDDMGKVNELEAKIAELEKELASAKAATESWKAKAEEYYAAKQKAPKPPAAPKKPTAKKKPAKKPKNEVNLEALLATMREWCEKHPNTAANRRPGNLASVRIEGVGKNDEDTQRELLDLGFRWAKGAQCWMYGQLQAEKQGKTVIDGR